MKSLKNSSTYILSIINVIKQSVPTKCALKCSKVVFKATLNILFKYQFV